jgi:hypothetical protein
MYKKKKVDSKFKTFCFDMDGVICTTKGNYYHKSLPIKKAIKKINDPYPYLRGLVLEIVDKVDVLEFQKN